MSGAAWRSWDPGQGTQRALRAACPCSPRARFSISLLQSWGNSAPAAAAGSPWPHPPQPPAGGTLSSQHGGRGGRPSPALTRGRQGTGGQRGGRRERSIREENAGQILPGETGEGVEGAGEHRSCPKAPSGAPGTAGPGPALTCAAARTFWFKLLPWRGSGGPANAVRHRVRFWGDVQLPGWGRSSDSGRARPLEQPRCWALRRAGLSLPAPRRAARCPPVPATPLLAPLPAASRMKAAFLFSCRRNWGEPWAHVCSRIFSTCPRGAGGQAATPQPSRGAGAAPQSPVQPHRAPQSPVQSHTALQSLAQPHAAPQSPVQPRRAQHNHTQPHTAPQSPVQPCRASHSPMQPHAAPQSPVQPHTAPRSPIPSA